MRTLRSERGQTAAEYVGVLLVAAAVVAVILSAGIGDAVAAKVEQAICQIATDRRECGDDGSAPPALARAAPNLYGAQARPALARMSVQGAKPLPLAARSEASTTAGLRTGARASTLSVGSSASLAQIGLPGEGKLGETGAPPREELFPYEDELNTLVNELSGEADTERAGAALREGRFGDAFLSGLLALPIVGKAPKLVKWAVRGIERAGKGLAGVVRRLGPRAKRLWKKLSEERGSVGGSGRNFPRPPAKDPQLDRAMEQLFRAADRYPGGTAEAIRRGHGHIIKGKDRVRELGKILKRKSLDDADRATAERVRNDLIDALKSQGEWPP